MALYTKWLVGTVCPRSSDPFYIVTYHIKWVTSLWTYSSKRDNMSLCNDLCIQLEMTI